MINISSTHALLNHKQKKIIIGEKLRGISWEAFVLWF